MLEDPWGDHAIAVKFDRIAGIARGLARAALRRRGGGRRPARRARGRSGARCSGALPLAGGRAGVSRQVSRAPAVSAAGCGFPLIFRAAATIRGCRAGAVSLRAQAARAVGQPRRDSREQSRGVSSPHSPAFAKWASSGSRSRATFRVASSPSRPSNARTIPTARDLR